MNSNFTYNITATSKNIKLFFDSIFHDTAILGFVAGFVVAVLITGFVLSKHPKNLPTILRYSSADGFQKLAARDKGGTYTMSYSNFVKIHTQIRTLFFIALISFFVMITTIVLSN